MEKRVRLYEVERVEPRLKVTYYPETEKEEVYFYGFCGKSGHVYVANTRGGTMCAQVFERMSVIMGNPLKVCGDYDDFVNLLKVELVKWANNSQKVR